MSPWLLTACVSSLTLVCYTGWHSLPSTLGSLCQEAVCRTISGGGWQVFLYKADLPLQLSTFYTQHAAPNDSNLDNCELRGGWAMVNDTENALWIPGKLLRGRVNDQWGFWTLQSLRAPMRIRSQRSTPSYIPGKQSPACISEVLFCLLSSNKHSISLQSHRPRAWKWKLFLSRVCAGTRGPSPPRGGWRKPVHACFSGALNPTHLPWPQQMTQTSSFPRCQKRVGRQRGSQGDQRKQLSEKGVQQSRAWRPRWGVGRPRQAAWGCADFLQRAQRCLRAGSCRAEPARRQGPRAARAPGAQVFQAPSSWGPLAKLWPSRVPWTRSSTSWASGIAERPPKSLSRLGPLASGVLGQVWASPRPVAV